MIYKGLTKSITDKASLRENKLHNFLRTHLTLHIRTKKKCVYPNLKIKSKFKTVCAHVLHIMLIYKLTREKKRNSDCSLF